MKSHIYLIISVLCVLFFSCSTQNLFQSQAVNKEKQKEIDSIFMSNSLEQYRLRVDDKVNLSIWNHDDVSIGSLYGIYNSNEVYGKWVMVDPSGKATFPKLGKINVEGLTLIQVEDTLQNLYSESIKKPVIEVKVLNREVSVLGQVKTPGRYLLEKEKNTLFEMLSRAGGMDFYADKTKIKIIRKVKDKNYEFLVDLTKGDQFYNQNIYLKSDDVVYIPTRKGKMIDKKAPVLIPLTSVATTLVIILSLFNK